MSKKKIQKYHVVAIENNSIRLEGESEQIDVPKYKMPLEVSVGECILFTERGVYEKHEET